MRHEPFVEGMYPKFWQAAAPALPWQAKKCVEVKNAGETAIKVHVLYIADAADGTATWLPAAGEDGASKPMTWTIKAGQTFRLATEKGAILTSRVRIWAESDAGSWEVYREKDQVLVDDAYQAESPEASQIKIGG